MVNGRSRARWTVTPVDQSLLWRKRATVFYRDVQSVMNVPHHILDEPLSQVVTAETEGGHTKPRRGLCNPRSGCRSVINI